MVRGLAYEVDQVFRFFSNIILPNCCVVNLPNIDRPPPYLTISTIAPYSQLCADIFKKET